MRDSKGRFLRTNPINRFWDKVTFSDDLDSCWIWSGHTVNNYGQFSLDHQKEVLAHRYSFELANGKITDSLTIDHLCRNTLCVNPNHLEMVSRGDNVLRGDTISARNKAKVFCKHGHRFTSENTYVTPDGRRNCKTCRAERQQNRIKGEK